MPQGSFDRRSELHRLDISLLLDEVFDCTKVMLVAKNHDGGIVASGAVALRGFEEVELLPSLLSSSARGWLYAGSFDAVIKPLQEARLAARELKRLHL